MEELSSPSIMGRSLLGERSKPLLPGNCTVRGVCRFWGPTLALISPNWFEKNQSLLPCCEGLADPSTLQKVLLPKINQCLYYTNTIVEHRTQQK